jgi:hypothetical protein
VIVSGRVVVLAQTSCWQALLAGGQVVVLVGGRAGRASGKPKTPVIPNFEI